MEVEKRRRGSLPLPEAYHENAKVDAVLRLLVQIWNVVVVWLMAQNITLATKLYI